MRISNFCILLCSFLFTPFLLKSQCGQSFKILHFTKTSGYDHTTRTQSLQMFQELGQANNFTVTHDNTGDEFNSFANLQQYAVIVFSNTSGNNLLSTAQQQNFENYMNSGGGFLGIHGATDTYRHSTANGSATGGWDFYAEMVGASITGSSPKHTSSNHAGTMDHTFFHPSTDNLPDPWNKVEEYYYWENGFYYEGRNNTVLNVRSTGSNSYDEKRAVSWYQHLPSGGRAFSTSMGHNKSDYTTVGNNFRKHMLDALLWAADNSGVLINEFNGVDQPGSWSRQEGRLYTAGDNTFPYTVGIDKLYMSNYRNGANNQHLVRDGMPIDPTRQYAVECKFKIIPSGGNINSFCLNFQVKGDDNYTGSVNCWSLNVDVNSTNGGGVMKYMGFKGTDGSFASIGDRRVSWARNNTNYLFKVEVNTRLDGSYSPKWIRATVVDLTDMSLKEQFEQDYSSFSYQPDYSGNATVRVGANTHGTAWDMWDYYVYYLDDELCNGGNNNNCPAIGTVNVQVVDESCAGQDGSISYNPSGGTAPYTFLWSTGETTQNLGGLSAGNYVLTLTDADSCSKQFNFAVGNVANLSLASSVVVAESCQKNDGRIQLNITGGTAPYSINWSDGSSLALRDNLKEGTYAVEITDALQCSIIDSFEVGFNASEFLLSEFNNSPETHGDWSIIEDPNSLSSFSYTETDSLLLISGTTNKNHSLVREGVYVDPNRPFIYETQFRYNQPDANAFSLLFMVKESGNTNYSWAANMIQSQGRFKYLSYNPGDDHYSSFFVDPSYVPIQEGEWFTYRLSVNQMKNGTFAPKWVYFSILAPDGSQIGEAEVDFSSVSYQPNLNEQTRIGLNAYDSDISFRNIRLYYTDSETCLNNNALDIIPAYSYPFKSGVGLDIPGNRTFPELAELALKEADSSSLGPVAQFMRVDLGEKHMEGVGGVNAYSSDFLNLSLLNGSAQIAQIGFPQATHQSSTVFCGSSNEPGKVYANLFDPIWEVGQEGIVPNPDNYFAQYLFELASAYQDYIHIWEVGDQVDKGIMGSAASGEPGNWWDNNPDPCDLESLKAPIQYYIRMLRISYEIIKTVDPESWISLGGIQHPAFLDAVLRNTDNPVDGSIDSLNFPFKGGAYFDIVGMDIDPNNYPSVKSFDGSNWVYHRHSDSLAQSLSIAYENMEQVLASRNFDGGTYPQKYLSISGINIPRKEFGDLAGGEHLQRNFLIKAFINAQKLGYLNFTINDLFENTSLAAATQPEDVMGLYEANVSGQNFIPTNGAISMASLLQFVGSHTYDAQKTMEMELDGTGINGAAFMDSQGELKFILWGITEFDYSEYILKQFSFPLSFSLESLDRSEWNYLLTQNLINTPLSEIRLNGDPSFFNPNPIANFPIELVDFQARQAGNYIKLQWTTAYELNNDFFTIEKSRDGQIFSPMENIPSQGNNNVAQSYESIDASPFPGETYYRLKQTDLDGSFQYFPKVKVSLKAENAENILYKLYPNPVRNGEALTLSFSIGYTGEFTCTILNLLGQEVYTGEFVLSELNNKIKLRLDQLQTGAYFLMVKATNDPDGVIVGSGRFLLQE